MKLTEQFHAKNKKKKATASQRTAKNVFVSNVKGFK